MRRQFPSLRGTTWCNDERSAWNGSRFDHICAFYVEITKIHGLKLKMQCHNLDKDWSVAVWCPNGIIQYRSVVEDNIKTMPLFYRIVLPGTNGINRYQVALGQYRIFTIVFTGKLSWHETHHPSLPPVIRTYVFVGGKNGTVNIFLPFCWTKNTYSYLCSLPQKYTFFKMQ